MRNSTSTYRKFCLDTSFFVNSWRKYYRPETFPGYWKAVDNLIQRQRIFSCREVYEELREKDDDVFDWAKQRRRLFCEPSDDVTMGMSQLMAKHPNIAAHGRSRNKADPWVILQAQEAKAIVVTDEKFHDRVRDTKPIGLPNVCVEWGVDWMGLSDFLEANDLTFEAFRIAK